VTPENVVSKRKTACASLRKRLLTQRDKITQHSPTHGRSSQTCSRALLKSLSAAGLNVKPRRPIRLRAA
jgi:hypothetical protein